MSEGKGIQPSDSSLRDRDQAVLDRKHVLFLTSSAPRSANDPTAPFILNMARDLQDLGWRVTILAPHAPGLERTEVLDGVTIARFKYMWPAKCQTLCYEGGVAANLRRNKLNALAIPFFAIAALAASLRYIIRDRPDIVHSHWVLPQGVIGQLLARTGARHVTSVHGADIYGYRRQPWRFLKAWVLENCDHIIANSSSTRSEIEALCQRREISTIPTGTTPFPAVPPKLQTDRSAFASEDSKIILFVGRLIDAKGVQYLIDALPLILERQPATLLIVGDGPARASLEKKAKSTRVERYVQFVGPVPHKKIYEYFSVADVFVGPSIAIPGEWTEAQGNTFVEALFARVPVVASRVGGIPDSIIHERTGLLVDERSPDQIARAVLRIFSDAPLADSLKEAGYHHANRNFSRFASASKIDGVYRAVLAQRGAR